MCHGRDRPLVTRPLLPLLASGGRTPGLAGLRLPSQTDTRLLREGLFRLTGPHRHSPGAGCPPDASAQMPSGPLGDTGHRLYRPPCADEEAQEQRVKGSSRSLKVAHLFGVSALGRTLGLLRLELPTVHVHDL